MERSVEMSSVLHRKKLSNKKILALHFALFCCENPSERESRETKQKKRVKQRGSQTIFYSMTFLNKNIVHRSKVYLCTAVVWKERHIFLKTGKYVPSITTRAPSLYCGYFKGLFCKMVNAGAISMIWAYKQKHLPIIKNPLVTILICQVKN